MAAHAHLRVGACLSLSGRLARFGRQAADALAVWREWDGAAELVIEDDRSDPEALAAAITALAGRCDILLGPYSTQLVRRASRLAAESGWLLWNHGGSGDDVQAAHPGHVVSIPTPTSRYAEPFLRWMLADGSGGPLWVVHGQGRFGRQVARGAGATARRLGIQTVIVGPDGRLEPSATPWSLFSAGSFEDDVEIVKRAMARPEPPELVCSVAAGVQAFSEAFGRVPSGTFGVGQWHPGAARPPQVGPDEGSFLAAYGKATGVVPDYPAAQALAAAVIATHAAREAGGATRDRVWPIATRLDTATFFGAFAVDPVTGAQVKHEAVLVRWADGGLARA